MAACLATLVMVAKYPQAGKCKTRLAVGIGADAAAAFARAALCDLLEVPCLLSRSGHADCGHYDSGHL